MEILLWAIFMKTLYTNETSPVECIALILCRFVCSHVVNATPKFSDELRGIL